MNEMIERAAQAIYEKCGGKLLFGISARVPEWSEINHDFKGIFRAQARAAIEAMRPPTETMIDAGKSLGDDYHYDSPAKTWPTMIEAALRDGEN